MAKRNYAPRYEVKRTGDQWFFHVIASNGEIIAHSEAYRRKAGALRGIRAVKRATTIRVIE